MFETQTKTITTSHERSYGHAVCDRCGHVMDESDHRSGYNNLTLLRFRAGFGSKFGEGSYIEGDFCDACLFELISPYVRVIDDERVPDSEEFFRIQSPRRLFAEHQIAGAVADGLWMTVRDWVEQCFDPKFTRRPVASKRAGAVPDNAEQGQPAE
jgi:hypothetical protein